MDTKKISILFFAGMAVFLGLFLLSYFGVLTREEALEEQAGPAAETPAPPAEFAKLEYLKTIDLPAPKKTGFVSVEQVLNERRSRRAFAASAVSLKNFSQILWAAQGVTDEKSGFRTSPSAHSVYPMEIYAAVSGAEGLAPGIYHYLPDGHKLGLLKEGAMKELLKEVSPQPHPQAAPVTLFIAGNYLKFREYFDDKTAEKSALQESGHIAENVYLQVEALGLATVVMGGFDPEKARLFVGAPEYESVVYLMPFGNRAE